MPTPPAQDLKNLSKFLSKVLRHAPQEIGIALDPQGWADIDLLLARANACGVDLDREAMTKIVQSSDKQRFTLSGDGQRIRAAQGHSVEVDLALPAQVPPALLFHGTAETSLAPILRDGLIPGGRQQVHLSTSEETARKVGQRHGVPVVLRVDAKAMHADGHFFWMADNGVWLVDAVPPRYLMQLS